ncbi:hypothetical protein Q1695_003550 [Nippostrongylus brasiliensis]|nr:hypothetical protein Q1695_003550 [Nippostrongylus brasiliensis]
MAGAAYRLSAFRGGRFRALERADASVASQTLANEDIIRGECEVAQKRQRLADEALPPPPREVKISKSIASQLLQQQVNCSRFLIMRPARKPRVFGEGGSTTV